MGDEASSRQTCKTYKFRSGTEIKNPPPATTSCVISAAQTTCCKVGDMVPSRGPCLGRVRARGPAGASVAPRYSCTFPNALAFKQRLRGHRGHGGHRSCAKDRGREQGRRERRWEWKDPLSHCPCVPPSPNLSFPTSCSLPLSTWTCTMRSRTAARGDPEAEGGPAAQRRSAQQSPVQTRWRRASGVGTSHRRARRQSGSPRADTCLFRVQDGRGQGGT